LHRQIAEASFDLAQGLAHTFYQTQDEVELAGGGCAHGNSPLLDVSPNWRYGLPMSTKHRFRDKYRIELREKDHLPPHVHLTGGGVDVLISLETCEAMLGRAPTVVLKEALAWVRAHQDELLEEWHKWHL
jgi:hypothetical protein